MKIQAKLRGKKAEVQAFIKAIEDSDLSEIIVSSDFVNVDGENSDLHLTFSSTEKNQMYWELQGLMTLSFIFVIEYITNKSSRNFVEIAKAYINMSKTFMEEKSPSEVMQFVTEKLSVLYDNRSN